MNIAFDAKRAFNNKSGLGNYSRDIIRAALQKPEDCIYLFSPKINNSIFNIDKLESKSISVSTILPEEPVDKIFSGYWRSFSIIKNISKLDIDIYHGLSNEIPLTLGKSVKTIVTIHDLIFKRYPQWYKAFDRLIYDWKFKTACNNSDKIIAISEQTKTDIINFYGVEASKIEVVYQTCNESFKEPASQKLIALVKEKYSLPDTFILNVGTIEPRKNALNIVKAMHQHKLDTPLVIIGRNTKYAEEIKEYIDIHKLDSQVKILHEVSNQELPVFYQLAKIFIYPSTFEGFGIPIIEALYSGTPVITSKGSCFSEPGGENSIYVELNDIEALANSISSLLNNNEQCQIMRQKGLEYVTKFDTNIVNEQLYKVYNELLK